MHFPSKILLFGEYSLVLGGGGFAIPYSKYSGELKIDNKNSSHSLTSNDSLFLFSNFLESNSEQFHFLNLNELKADLNKGLWFSSNIPNGYGLGSSGAMMAAIYSKYKNTNESNFVLVRQHLAEMESFFHGHSSGIDPTVSYLMKPVLIKNFSSIELLTEWSIDKLGYSVFMVDTEATSKTKTLVDWFKMHMTLNEFKKRTELDFFVSNQNVIRSIEAGNLIDMNDLLAISRYQMDYLSPMVPTEFRQHFFAGIESGDFAFKLCGSGGGGFMLCFAKNEALVKQYFNQAKLNFEIITIDR